MKNQTLMVVRDGEIKLRIPQAVVKDDGTVWGAGGKFPVLGITDPEEKERVKKLIEKGDYSEVPAEYFCHLGNNDNGLWVGDIDDCYQLPEVVEKRKQREEQRGKEEAEKRKIITVHLSSRGWGDFSPVEWSGSVETSNDKILSACRKLLETGHDVDIRNQTDEEILGRILKAKDEWKQREGEIKVKREEKERQERQREEMRKSATMTTKIKHSEYEGGKVVEAVHVVTLKDTGESYEFSDRNVFDFGRVINPRYSVTEGRESGGLRVGDNWQDFDSEKGWHDIRPLTDGEKMAYDYVQEFGYHSRSGMRM